MDGCIVHHVLNFGAVQRGFGVESRSQRSSDGRRIFGRDRGEKRTTPEIGGARIECFLPLFVDVHGRTWAWPAGTVLQHRTGAGVVLVGVQIEQLSVEPEVGHFW